MDITNLFLFFFSAFGQLFCRLILPWCLSLGFQELVAFFRHLLSTFVAAVVVLVVLAVVAVVALVVDSALGFVAVVAVVGVAA